MQVRSCPSCSRTCRSRKVLRTDGALQAAIDGTMTVGSWVKLVDLLNHLVCILLMPYYIMYDVYTISDACPRKLLKY